ncbi:MAG: lactonase family protein [Variovorax sp.]|nr:MAG: lactonase family protein [Variovorax sp.]
MKTVVYVSHAESGDVRVFALDTAAGVLTPLQQLDVGGMLMPMAVSPDQRFLYVARRSAPMAAVALAIDPASGLLTRLGEGPLPHSMAAMATDRTGRWLFSASYGGALVAINPIAANGIPGEAQEVLATGPNAHCIQADPTNRHVYATSLGGNVLHHWRFDAATGRLTPGTPASVSLPDGAGARHFVFDATGRFAWLLGELDGSVSSMRFAGDGTPEVLETASSLPPGFVGEPWAADIHLTPDGRFLYTSERRSSTLATFEVDPASGRLTLRGHAPTETQPRGFAVEPGGRCLVAAGQLSHRLTVHRIDPATGALQTCSTLEVGRDPNWIEIISLPQTLP